MLKNDSTGNAIYDFSITLNTDYLKKILPLFTQHHIAANPINYAIFYDYVAGQNTALNSEVDSLLSQHKPFDVDTSFAIYEKFICTINTSTLEKINQQIQKVLLETSNAISNTCNQAEESHDNFQKKSALLESLPESQITQAILQEIIQETHGLAESSRTMQTELNKANAEMAQLRSELTQVRQMSITDGLTGLLNRRAFDQTLSEIIEHPNSETTCLAMFDIDHFKRVNDSFGHTTGDHVIKFVATLLTKHVEEGHHVARYGGEELAIIMPNTPKKKAIEIAENIRAEMEKSRLKRKTDKQSLGQITISIGIAELQPNDSEESLITRADTALYQAKESGRNKVMH